MLIASIPISASLQIMNEVSLSGVGVFPEGTCAWVAEEEAQAEIFVDESLPYFEGHFPDNPLVPGVVQMGWMLELANCLAGQTLLENGYSCKNVKFLKPIVPNMSIVVIARIMEKQFDVRIQNKDTFFAKGKIV